MLNENNLDESLDYYEEIATQQKVDEELELERIKRHKKKEYNQNEPGLDEERLRVLLLS